MESAPRLRCMVLVAGGPARRVGAGGLLIGRAHDCDIVADDPSVSRRHALIRATRDGAELVPLGRAPVVINGAPHDKVAALADGDRIELAGMVLSVVLEARRPDTGAPSGFALARARGGSFGISHTPFLVGGGATDDLIVKGWPAAALRFHVAQGALLVETTGGARKNGDELEADALVDLAPGDEVAFKKESFAIKRIAGDARTTLVTDAIALPRRVAVQILPRGGRVVFALADGERAVFLSDRRLDLMVALLRPPAPYVAGDFIPDDVVRPVVWPRTPGVSRPEINMLISRCRQDLVAAGLHGPRLLERAPGGGATRVALTPGAVIEVA